MMNMTPQDHHRLSAKVDPSKINPQQIVVNLLQGTSSCKEIWNVRHDGQRRI